MKKNLLFMIICLFVGAGLNQLTAQNLNPEGNSFWIEESWGTIVWCDGINVDFIYGTMKVHAVEQYKDGILQRQIVQALGEATSWVTGEEFKYMEVGKWYPLEEKSTFHYNFLGKNGSHYMGSYVITSNPWTITPGDCKCF